MKRSSELMGTTFFPFIGFYKVPPDADLVSSSCNDWLTLACDRTRCKRKYIQEVENRRKGRTKGKSRTRILPSCQPCSNQVPDLLSWKQDLCVRLPRVPGENAGIPHSALHSASINFISFRKILIWGGQPQILK